MSDALDREVDANFDSFQSLIPSLIAQNRRGQFALMRERAVLDFFSTPSDALREGRERFPDALFSIQEVTDRPVDLGFFSHAVDTRLA